MAKGKATKRDATKAKRSPVKKKSIAATPAAASKSRDTAFPIVGIGASAGGLEAMEELLDNMPVDTGMAFVVVTHQHPGHSSMLPELLGKQTEMPVVEAADGLKVQANRVYVGPPGGHLAILNGTLHRMETGREAAPKLPIDYFFRSLAEDQQERAICIILSGTGTDGTLGLKAVKAESGMAMVEQPQVAKYAGMPSSAIATGLADYVLPPAEMPKQLVAVDVSPARLERYFTRDDSTYRIRKEIREMTIFAPQNVIKDPPFTKLDVLSCRNLLIYLNADLQKKLLPIFHYALKPDGLLFLGPSETIGSFTDLFEPLDKRWKIFRRKECATALHMLPDMPAQPVTRDEGEVPSAAARPTLREAHISTVLERTLLSRFVPASVVVNECGDIIYIHGRTGAYLEPSQGQPRTNVLEMAREGLSIEMAAAIRQCVTKGTDVLREDIRVKSNGSHVHIDLSVTKLSEPETVRGLLLVTFRPAPAERADLAASKARSSAKRKEAGDGPRIEQLERELQYMRESHQTTLEELETSNEELKSTNEELQSTNEELQSTNEELETSKEEMQSLNEELTTVNAELQSKVDDLSQSNDDMQNLLNSTDIATVFLDNNLNIKRFTEHSKELVMLRPTDVGRPITELASNLEHDKLPADCREVLKTLMFKESEVSTKDGGAYLMRIMPYRTTENVIDGLVITFVNVGQLKEAQKAGEQRAFFESIVDTVRQPLLVLDNAHRVVSANRCFLDTFRLRPKQILGTPVFNVGDGEWNIPELRKLLEEILPEDTMFEDFRVDHEFPRVGRKVLLLNARRLERERGLSGMILLAMEDISKEQAT